MPPFGAIVGSILGVIAWLVFILLYALYWSKGFSLFQNIIVTIVSITIDCLAISLMWLVWLRSSSRTSRHRADQFNPKPSQEPQ